MRTAVRFSDLYAQNEPLVDEINAAINTVIKKNEFCLGSEVIRFEEAFASFLGARHVIGVNSGTSALHLALLALDVGAQHEVITVASTFVATAAAIRYTGARPVFVDIDPVRFTIDPKKIEASINAKTAAILPVHLYGQMADMDPICQIAAKHGVPVIEDAAQAHGATYKGAAAGTLGRIGCFSFYPGKVLGAFGEGGAVVTNDDRLAMRIRAMRDWGQVERGIHQYPCFNYRMDGIQGAVLAIKLRYIRDWINARKAVAATYDRLFERPSSLHDVALPVNCADGNHVYHQYAVRLPRRDLIRAELNRRGIETGVHYARPVHLQPAFHDLGYAAGTLPCSEALAETTLSLPIYPGLPVEALDRVVNEIHSMTGNRASSI